jgi:hypothetical protein
MRMTSQRGIMPQSSLLFLILLQPPLLRRFSSAREDEELCKALTSLLVVEFEIAPFGEGGVVKFCDCCRFTDSNVELLTCGVLVVVERMGVRSAVLGEIGVSGVMLLEPSMPLLPIELTGLIFTRAAFGGMGPASGYLE